MGDHSPDVNFRSDATSLGINFKGLSATSPTASKVNLPNVSYTNVSILIKNSF